MWLLKGYPKGEHNLLLKDYNVTQATFHILVINIFQIVHFCITVKSHCIPCQKNSSMWASYYSC